MCSATVLSVSSTYNKPFLSVDQQLSLLDSRGMDLGNRDAASDALRAVGYYRLSGYWRQFRKQATPPATKRPSDFVDGTTLHDVLSIYRFDERLRAEMLRAVSRIEVAIRFQVGHLLGQRGAFAHNDAAVLDPDWSTPKTRKGSGPNCGPACAWPTSEHADWMRKQTNNEKISNEAFIAHIHNQYGKPLPVWTATETMTFGDLNRLFGGLTQRDRQQIASTFDLFTEDGNGDAATLSSWLEHFRITRNYSAHHGRLWNRNHAHPLKVPHSATELRHLAGEQLAGGTAAPVSPGIRRLYGTVALIAFMSARIERSNDTRNGLLELILGYAGGDAAKMTSMGFPAGWQSQTIWKRGYRRDITRSSQAALLRNAELLYDRDAATLLTTKPTYKAQKALLRFYRREGAALSTPGVESHRYPAFQFDAATGDLVPLVVLANRRLLDGGEGTDQQRWDATKWWLTASDTLPDARSPMDAVRDGVLTQEWLDGALPPRDDESAR